MKSGSCLCGNITFDLEGNIPNPDACHCHECRKFSGHFFVSTDVLKTKLNIKGSESLTWYRIDNVRRGFCSNCGSSLFWEADDCDWIAVALGAFDFSTECEIEKHIFVSEKGDYYEINDDKPQFQHQFL